MKTLNVSEFREQCLQLLESLPNEGLLITKRGQPMAKLMPVRKSCLDFIGVVEDWAVDPDDDLFSTGATWNAESRYPHSDKHRS